jgi:hypothetical protein
MKIVFESPREKWIAWASLFLLVALVGTFIAMRETQMNLLSKQKRTGIHDRVVNVVEEWIATTSPPDDNRELTDVWANSPKSFPFYPDAAQDLASRLQKEFRESRTVVVQTGDIYDGQKNSNGSVKTVVQLSDHVRQQYDPQ